MSVALLAKRPVRCMQRCRHSYLDRVVCPGYCEDPIVNSGCAVAHELLSVARVDLLHPLSVRAFSPEGESWVDGKEMQRAETGCRTVVAQAHIPEAQPVTTAHSTRPEHEEPRQAEAQLAWEKLSCSKHRGEECKGHHSVKWLAVVEGEEGWEEDWLAAQVQSFVFCHRSSSRRQGSARLPDMYGDDRA